MGGESPQGATSFFQPRTTAPGGNQARLLAVDPAPTVAQANITQTTTIARRASTPARLTLFSLMHIHHFKAVAPIGVEPNCSPELKPTT